MQKRGFRILRLLPRDIRREVLAFHRGQYERDKEQGFWILRALPREIREEVLSFHHGQYIIEHEREWNEQHFVEFKVCLTELMLRTQSIRITLDSLNFSSTRSFEFVQDTSGIIHQRSRSDYLKQNVSPSRIIRSPCSSGFSLPFWAVENFAPMYRGGLNKTWLLDFLDESREWTTDHWKKFHFKGVD
jgi:hypothetical protein